MSTDAPIERLISGFRDFRGHYFERHPELFETLQTGQAPQVMFVACVDSRVDPAILTRSEPGEIFVLRNVANIVPPYLPGNDRNETGSALEFAVCGLGVRHIVVLGHAMCGGIRCLVELVNRGTDAQGLVEPWVSTVRAACAGRPATPGEPGSLAAIEQAAIRVSLAHLETYPWIRTRVAENGDLQLHGWWFDLRAGGLWIFDPRAEVFRLNA